jgi:hypothetical protein
MSARPSKVTWILGVLAAAALATAAPASAAPVLTASCLPVSVGDGVIGDPSILLTSAQTLAQPFTASRAGTLSEAALALEKTPGTTDPLVAELWSYDRLSGQPETLLEEAGVPSASVRDLVPGSPELTVVPFDEGTPIAEGADYALVLSTLAGVDPANPGLPPTYYAFRVAQDPCPNSALSYSQTGIFLPTASSGAFTATVNAPTSDPPASDPPGSASVPGPVQALPNRKCMKRKKPAQHKTRKCKRRHRPKR